VRVVDDLNAALHRLMDQDAGLHVIGEDVLDPYGGAFKVTRGLSTKHPDRVLTMPISEAGLIGFGMGMAMRGRPVIAEVMFGDFLALGLDQLLNHAAKLNWMFNGAVEVPLVVRAPMGGGRGYGPTHSQSIEKHFCGIPGLTVLAANQFASPGRLLERAVSLRSPVLLIENKVSYAKLVEAERIRPSTSPDLVILTYGGVAEACVRVAERLHEQEEIEVGVTVLEQLSPIDGEALARAVGGCRRVLAVEEGVQGWGFGSECARLLLEAGRELKFASVAAKPMPIPNSKDWELATLPNEPGIAAAALALALLDA
jgi:pyruvate/2-oxoglutarate/acetoin dehydrogenase E1 component